MKTVYGSLLVIVALTLIGCDEGTPGGPGVTKKTPSTPTPSTTEVTPDTTPLTTPDTTSSTTPSTTPETSLTDADNTFRLDAPNLTTALKQGESKSISIAISRETNFMEDVALTFSGVPDGVTITPADPMILKGDTEAKLTIAAAEDAAIGDFKIKIVGHPTKGADATNEFSVSVSKP